MHAAMNVQVFIREEKERAHIPAGVINRRMEEQTSRFLQAMARVMRRRDLQGRVRWNEWPQPRSGKAIVRGEWDLHYRHLEDPDYDADIAVCVVPSMEHVDGAVGSLLLRERGLMHLCLLSSEPLPEYEENEDLYRGILAIPAGIERPDGQRFYVPANAGASDAGGRILNAAEARTMTVNSFPDLTGGAIENVVDIVRFRKAS